MFCFSWWETTTNLGWALLELSEGLSFFKSADSFSETLAQLLFAAYLVIAIILLINMLIALLSNTYQRVQVSDHWSKSMLFGVILTFKLLSSDLEVGGSSLITAVVLFP